MTIVMALPSRARLASGHPRAISTKQVDRSVFKGVNTVGQQRYRRGSQCDSELEEKVGEVDQRHVHNDPAQAPGIQAVDDHIAKLSRGVPARTARTASNRCSTTDNATSTVQASLTSDARRHVANQDGLTTAEC